MKKLLFLFILSLPFFCHAQNWKSVRLNDTTYFTIPTAENYLRMIWVDSATTSGSDSIFHFYPSIRLGNTTSNCLDTLGPTWLGRRFIKKSNGDEIFFNRWLDTIILKPTTTLNSTWLMHTDTANNEYRATITSQDTLTIDNQLDSIKEVSIQVFDINNIALTSHVHYNRKIILSKEHGFVKCIESYGFPDNYNFNNYFMHPNGGEWYPNFLGSHIKVEKKFNYTKGRRLDPSIVFKPGNEWHSYRAFAPAGAPGKAYFFTIDSIISYLPVGLDSVLVIKKFSEFTYTTKTQQLDTSYFYLGVHDSIQNYLFPEHNWYTGAITLEPFINCGLDYLITYQGSNSPFIAPNPTSPCAHIMHSLSGWSNTITRTITGYPGRKYFYYTDGFTPNSQTYHDSVLTLYYKIDSCVFGTPIDFGPLSIQNIETNNISFYPNPTNNTIHFAIQDNAEVLGADLFSLQGKLIRSCETCNQLNTADVTNGLYILSVKTSKGIIRKKILIQH